MEHPNAGSRGIRLPAEMDGAAQKLAILAEFQVQGVMLDELAEEVGKDLDPFDLICHVAFDQPPLTRQERANNVKKRNYLAKYGEPARAILNALLDKYADAGIDSIEDLGILRVFPFSKFGTPVEIIKLFWGKDQFLAALQELEAELYSVAWRASVPSPQFSFSGLDYK